MVVPGPNPSVGTQLRELRLRVGLTTREVETRSHLIADERHNQEFYVSHAWLTDIENDKFTPGMFKLFSLSVVYHRKFTDLLSIVGIPLSEVGRLQRSMELPKTHLLQSQTDIESEPVSLPVEFKPEFQLEKTNLLARVVAKWDRIPVSFLQHLDLHKSVYGYIGLEDYTLYPLIRPGSLVEIDSTQRKLSAERWQTEYDRPIYFVELRHEYVCSWCQVDRGQLFVIPHPHSRLNVRQFDYPSQAEIVGRVTGVAMRIVGERGAEVGEAVRSVQE